MTYRDLFYSLALLFVMCIPMACDQAQDSAEEEEVEEYDDPRDEEIRSLRSIEKEVLNIHDEVMPKMSDLNNTRGKLIKYLDADGVNPEYAAMIPGTVQQLEAADSLMWDWMHNYGRPDYDENLDSARIYLDNELETVKHMKVVFLESMEQGHQLLNKLDESDK